MHDVRNKISSEVYQTGRGGSETASDLGPSENQASLKYPSAAIFQ